MATAKGTKLKLGFLASDVAIMKNTTPKLGVLLFFIAATVGHAKEPLVPHRDHGGPELRVPGPVRTPIQHEKYFRGERELFGYYPRFLPGVVTFGPDNEPYIAAGWYFQTVDASSVWQTLDISQHVRKTIAEATGYVSFSDPHLSFDQDGDAYLLGRIIRTGNRFQYGLFHSQDRCRTWTFYPTPTQLERLERLEAHNELLGPPPMVEGRGGELRLVVAKKNDDGSLRIDKQLVVAKVVSPVAGKGRHWITPRHSGAGNVTATFGGKTHIVWLSIQPLAFHRAAAEKLSKYMRNGYTPYAGRFELESLAPCYAATYDHTTETLSEPTILGFTLRDAHNGPVISVNSQGDLHVIIGAHHDNFLYTRSLQSNSTRSWSQPKPLGIPKQKAGEGSYTYTGLVCAPDDTLHLVSRWAGSGYYFRLVYQRKKRGAEWEPHQELVVPFRANYSAWYHSLNVDRRGRLFLNYSYLALQLTPEEKTAYRKKWPGDGYRREGAQESGVRRHDPSMLISDDGGDAWRIALTQDFAAGITDS